MSLAWCATTGVPSLRADAISADGSARFIMMCPTCVSSAVVRPEGHDGFIRVCGSGDLGGFIAAFLSIMFSINTLRRRAARERNDPGQICPNQLQALLFCLRLSHALS